MKLDPNTIQTTEVLNWKGLHLFNFCQSSCSQKVRILLAEKGIRYRSHEIDQKIHAIMAGIGIGHLPYARIHDHLKSGELVALNIEAQSPNDGYIVWKINNKGKGLRVLTEKLVEIKWQEQAILTT
jgi:DNA-binding transcriptional LysR family regulator